MAWGNDQIRELVIRTLLGESNRTQEGMVSVAHVMKNRADSLAYGNQNGGLMRAILSPKQFSMWNNDDPKLRALAAGVKAIPTSDANYQRAAAIADGVFGGTIPDTTNGATFYHTPDVHPAWSEGKTPVATIGGHYFYKLPLGSSGAPGDLPAPAATSPAATTPGAAPLVADSGSSGGGGASGSYSPSLDTSDADRSYLASLSAHTDRAGDTANLNPQFATKLAAAIRQARNAGLPISVMSAFREPGQTASQGGPAAAYDAAGNSSHTYGLAADINGLDGPNGKITNAWAQIAAQNGLSNPYGVGNATEFNHWQVGPKLETAPDLLAALKTAKASGDWSKVWSAYNTYTPDAGPASSTAPAAAASAPIPAANVTPASATAPGSSGGNFAVPPGGAAPAPGSDKYSVIQGMTAGTGRNPMLYTAANFGNLFGGKAAPVAPPAAPAAPAAAPAATPPASLPVAPPGSPLTPTPPDLSKDAPIGTAGPTMPFLPNPFDNPAFPSTSAPPPPATTPAPITLPSLSAHWGADTPNDSGDLGHGRWLNGAPAATPGGPSMGFPAQTNPFGAPPPDQSSMNLPGSMLASAQNLIRLLFPPSQTG